MDQRDVMRRGIAEALGAGALVFFGAGAPIVLSAVQSPSLLVVGLANGLAIAIMVCAVGHISGGHFNPAITFGFWVTGRITGVMAGAYIGFQLLGSVVAALFLRGIFDDRIYDQFDGGAPVLSGGVGAAEGLLFEMVATFFLVFVVFATAVDERGSFKIVGGFAIGLVITLAVFVGGPLTGAALNPARAFGPELISGTWSDAWIYWIGPLVGGALGAGVYSLLYLDRPISVIGRPDTGVGEAGVERAERDVT